MFISRQNILQLLLLCIFFLTVSSVKPSEDNGGTYSIYLLDHQLSFSLPSEMTPSPDSKNLEHQFSLDDPSFVKNKFRILVKLMHDIGGSFWSGPYGSLKFNVVVQQRDTTLKGDISTIDGLEEYIKEWSKSSHSDGENYVVSRGELSGVPAILRERNLFGDQKRLEPDQIIVYSLPLNDEVFLSIVFNIKGWKAGRGKEDQWKPRAEALREAISKSVRLKGFP